MTKFAKNEFRKASPVSVGDVFPQLFDDGMFLQDFGVRLPWETSDSHYLGSASAFAMAMAANYGVSDSNPTKPDDVDKPVALTGTGAISLGAIDTAVTENFDTLASSSTSTTLPTGWYFDETGTSSNLTYSAGTGSGTTGDVYSFGATGSNERAFGSLQSGSVVPTLGAQFTNSTGAMIGSLDISYIGEQWRLGTAGRADSLVFQISFDATSVSNGTWATVSQLNFSSPVQAGATGALDGNLAANRTAISYSLVLANAVANGQSFWIRWTDTNATGSDDGLAIDNFSITPRAVAAVPGSLAINDVTLSEGNSGTTNYSFTVTRSGGTTGAVGATWTLANGTTDNGDFTAFPQSGTVNFADGQTSATITITIAGDAAFESNETFFVNLTSPTGGATIGDAQGQGTITNDDAAPVAQLSINDITQAEGNSGTTSFTFTVTRSGDTSIAASATWTAVNGTTDAADFTGALTGTVSFAAGETSRTVTVQVVGDADVEPNETFTVQLSNPSVNTTITDNSGAGIITNDDLPPIANVFINEIHYDNAGTDVGEAIEVAGLAGTNLTGWTLVLYNGNGGANYQTIALGGTIADQNNGYGTISVTAAGIQNGAPDGIALVDPFGRVVQFLSYEGVMIATAGPANGLTSIDIGVTEDPAPAAGLSLQLVGTGSSYADFTWVAAADDNFGTVNTGQTFLPASGPSQIRVADTQVIEGNSGTSSLTFIVYRAGGLASSASVDYVITLDGTANAADLGAGAVLSGTVSFAAGESQRTIIIPIEGDIVGEANETINITLSNPSGANLIVDAQGVGTIVNDDPVPLTIMQIQGEGHRSAYVGQPVSTTGIVTAVAANGFYIQDAAGDGNVRTSDAVFVFTSTAPTVAVGDGVTVSGTVSEFTGATGALSLTQIASPIVTVNSNLNSLPAAVLIGQGGILPPSEWIDDDGLTTYDPTTDGIDFWESLEGMRVTLDAPLVVANTNGFGETYAVVSGGTGASGVNAAGGITISPNASTGQSLGDFNPEMIQIDNDTTIFPGFAPNYTVGDRLSNVTGIVNYAFGTYEVIVTQAVALTNDVSIARDTTTLVGSATGLTMATYNVENLDPTDTRFNLLANDIVYALQAPDIIALQEIQDADGAGTGSNLSGTITAQLLIDAIVAAGGPTYTYIEVAPTVANTTGGEPNGNIRPGFLYNASRVNFISGSLTQVTDIAFNNSRSPLVASFSFNGQVVTAINVHFTSRGGSEALWGANQPPNNAGEAARTAQIAAVNAYVNNHLATNPAYDVVLMGDFNGFYFENEQLQLTRNGGSLINVGVANLPEAELYSYLFEGNSQLIDNIYTTSRLIAGSSYDAVHINALFNQATRPTDHDPQLARFTIAAGITLFGDGNTNSLIGTPGHDSLFGLDGDDVVNGLGDNDRLVGGLGSDQLFGGDGDDTLYMDVNDSVIDGGAGTDTIYFVGSGAFVGALASIESIQLAGGAALTLTGSQFNDGLANDTSLYGAGNITVNMTAGVFFVANNFVVTGGSNVTMTINGANDVNVIKAANVVNTINGGTDIDQIRGGTLGDSINGGSGDDKIIGFGGADTITGGSGADQFRYLLTSDSGFGAARDQITDFAIGSDRLNFLFFDADPLTAGDQAFNFVGTAAFTATGIGQVRYFTSGADILVQADVNGDGVADMEIVLQGIGGGTLTAGDFIL
jgi:uncharacterized protein